VALSRSAKGIVAERSATRACRLRWEEERKKMNVEI
jgi:hypothetical protein